MIVAVNAPAGSRPRSFAADFAAGASAPWRGLALLFRGPRFLWLALAPAAVSVLLFIAGAVWAFFHLRGWVEAFTLNVAASSLGSRAWIYLTALALAWPAFIAGLAFIGYLFARVISGPFCSILAERALRNFESRDGNSQGSGAPGRRGPGRLLRRAVASLAQEMALAVFGAALFALSFVPAVNAVAAAGYVFLVAFDCASYSLEAREIGLRGRLASLYQSFPVYAGYACSIAALLLVPGLNFLTYPIAVAGGAWLVARNLLGRS